MNTTFKDRFNQLYEDSSLSQEDFGQLFNASKSQVFNWRSGRGEPDTETIKIIARTCNVSVEWLIGLSDLRSSRPTTIALSRSDDPDSDLPDEALKQIEDFRAFIRQKYKKPD
jgi:transcriptional regulator with XRE-family HTH domain